MTKRICYQQPSILFTREATTKPNNLHSAIVQQRKQTGQSVLSQYLQVKWNLEPPELQICSVCTRTMGTMGFCCCCVFLFLVFGSLQPSPQHSKQANRRRTQPTPVAVMQNSKVPSVWHHHMVSPESCEWQLTGNSFVFKNRTAHGPTALFAWDKNTSQMM